MTLIFFLTHRKNHRLHFKYPCLEVLTNRKFSKAPQSWGITSKSHTFCRFGDIAAESLLPLKGLSKRKNRHLLTFL